MDPRQNELALVVYVSNNAYKIDVMKPIVESLEKQISIYIKELKELEEPKDLEHMLAMVEFENVANKVEKKKRGRKGNTMLIGPISVNFELPQQYFNNYEIKRVLANRPLTKFSAYERIMNWKMHLRKRIEDGRYDAYFLHLPSNITFRSKIQMVNFMLLESHPSNKDNNTSKKRKRNAMC